MQSKTQVIVVFILNVVQNSLHVSSNIFVIFPDYYETGFLYIQYMVDKFIIDVDAAGNSLDADTTISMQKMPFPAHIRDLLLNILQGTLPLFLILAFIVNVFQTTKNLAIEKEMKLKVN